MINQILDLVSSAFVIIVIAIIASIIIGRIFSDKSDGFDILYDFEDKDKEGKEWLIY